MTDDEALAAFEENAQPQSRKLSPGEHSAKVRRLSAAWDHAAKCLAWAAESGAPADEIRSLAAQVELTAYRTVAARKAAVAAHNEGKAAAWSAAQAHPGEPAEYIGLPSLRPASPPAPARLAANHLAAQPGSVPLTRRASSTSPGRGEPPR